MVIKLQPDGASAINHLALELSNFVCAYILLLPMCTWIITGVVIGNSIVRESKQTRKSERDKQTDYKSTARRTYYKVHSDTNLSKD